ncbi:extracellular solute-binding protein [Paenibacillus sp. JCM 10914]|uniref:extracellular solute-binding protein n=1 Tax=Paenibacillus sp. JCM 10914 TaxID=1236974 RepID=UPI0003CC6706|nr:extracellular solute-binding protein [Paenibacillus sp. JCM 10914]GAE09206.1 N-Acetyl-D-glucosamine ABC transport system, sugar-binding protein [Paenibacillus sp. JCM 10914]
MKSKSKFAGMIMLLLMFTLSACSGGSNGSSGGASQSPDSTAPNSEATAGTDKKDPVTIEFMGHGNPNEKKIFEKLIASFEEKYPHVTVKYTSVPPGEYSQKMTTLISSGKVPDVFYVGGSEFYRFAQAGTLLSLESYLDQTTLFHADNVWPQALDRYRYDGNKVGAGDLYGLPKDVGPWSFVYNKDLFDQANVPYPSAVAGEWTWDDMLEAAKKLSLDLNGDGKLDQFGVGAYT